MFTGALAYLGIACLYILSTTKYIAAVGALVPFALIASDISSDEKEPGFLARVLYRLSIVGLFPAILLAGNYLITGQIFGKYYFAGAGLAMYYAAAVVISSITCFAFLRFGVPLLNKAKAKLTRKSDLVRNTKTDIREMEKYVPPAKPEFDPRKYFDESKGIFLGLNEKNQPVYIDYDLAQISHILLSGRTRSGKGIALQALAPQLISRGEAVLMLDPKPDNHLPHIFKYACDAAGRPYHYLDLRQDAHEQTNIFEGCDQETIEVMMISGFSLSERGSGADHYKLLERRAAREAAAWLVAHPGSTAQDVVAALGDSWEAKASGFLEYMKELCAMPSVCRPGGTGGLDLASIEKTGGCLYVVGDMVAPKVLRLQRMILVRFMYLAKKRSQLEEGRTIRVIADEFKCHISKPFMTSLGASAGWGMTVVLPFQSLQDLAECPADLDKDAVRGAVMENTAIALSYQIKDPDTREWLAASTGRILVDDESKNLKNNAALAEIVEGGRTVRQAERFFIDDNMLKTLPIPEPKKKLIGCGVLDVAGKLAQFVYTSPLRVERTPAAITPTAPPMPAAPARRAGALDLDDLEPEQDYSESLSESLSLSESDSDSLSETETTGAGALDLDDLD